VYVFVRTCVRARAAAVAAVGLSQSCFLVPLCSTLLLLGRCHASTCSSSAPAGFFSARVLRHLPVTHRWASDGSVGPSSHSSSLCVGTLALLAGDRRARALQGIVCSTTKRVRRPVPPPTLHSCGSLSKSFGPSPSPPLSGSHLGSLSASACHPKRVRHPLLRGVHRLHVCVSQLGAVWCSASPSRSTQCLFHSRTPLNGLYFERTRCLLRAKRCGVSKLFFASLSSSSRAPCDALVGRLFNGGGGGGGGHGCVGGEVCSSLCRLVRRPYARSP
jgi:hypothetical protein